MRGASLERQTEIERADILSLAEKEHSLLRAERDGLAAQLRRAREQSATLEQRATELVSSEAKAETEASVWREAHQSAANAAMALEADKGQLAAALEQERTKIQQLLHSEERRKAAEREQQEVAFKAAAKIAREAAELPERLARARRADSAGAFGLSAVRYQAAADGLPPADAAAAFASEAAEAAEAAAAERPPSQHTYATGSADTLSLETLAVQRRLQEHSTDLREEALAIEQFREALNARQAAPQARGQQQQQHGGPPPTTATPGRVSFAPRPTATAPASFSARDVVYAATPPPPPPTYNLRSLADSLDPEETWWERYRRDVLVGADAVVAELE